MSSILHNRQREILKTIVELYIKTGKPISSEDVLKNSNIKASSATIRNDMQKLQRLGYIYQQHSSGGRIPRDPALKIYFEMIKSTYNLTDTHIDIPKKYKFYDLNLMFQNLSEMLSNVLDGLVILEYPDSKYVFITRVVVSPLTETHSVITILTNLGLTISRTVEIYGLPPSKELEKFLNNGLVGKSFSSLFYILTASKSEVEDLRITNFLEIIENITHEFKRTRYLVNGLEKIISKTKTDLDAIETLASIIENDTIKEEFFKSLDFDNDISLFFGNDFNSKTLKNLAFLCTTYRLNSNPLGKILFITQKYCDYEKIYLLLKEYISRLSEIISKNF
ncbi:heat-inducible transcriptional repressor HrcA [Petrotoga sp. 9PWA.NaAc.5.4]|uniref:HrcA family transcriptional regulator n=1 Tax=Petrotoga sp. 9PWA.NaAc.5.4 TaxID=1434328 RepID=UPI000CC711E7|nr:hypothetical protein [Petrotoga sp. 9PWA.NaAc.5.4]PNR94649.1 hypothetical protein X924_05810 [Petrotoga sp. 9PWA.NaAc.5.4]